jgi:hypothetical protein
MFENDGILDKLVMILRRQLLGLATKASIGFFV